MEVYDQQGKLLEEYDLEKGYLKEEIRIVHHDAVEGHYETVQEYPGGGKDVKWVVDEPGVEARAAWSEERTVNVYVPYTAEELAARERDRQAVAEEMCRQAAVAEVQTALIAAQINTLAVDDVTALRWRMLYPEWAPDAAYKTGEKVRRGDRLYRCLQGHTSQTGWEPEAAASLWTEVCESHAGTAEDPIPYSGNMALESGKFYSQGGVTYRCTRDTGNPVYNPLAELVGLYVEAA